MLRKLQQNIIKHNFAIQKKLFVYDSGNTDYVGNSGIRATIFGPSGLMGRPIAHKLGSIGSSIIMPVSTQYHYRHSENVKQLKVCGATNKSWLQWDMNFKNEKMIEEMVKNSNVVINLVGPRKKLKKRADFEFINIQVAERIARACKKYGVHRLIHFSAAGAQPNSPSLDFQTKYEAEQIVLKAFPNATIFRPCPIYGLNDYFAGIIHRQLNFFFNHFTLVYDDCLTKKQPIKESDVALCVLNALKLQETKGKTYQLGGPHALTYLQIHQIIFNVLKMRPKLAYVNKQWAMLLAKYIYNWQFFGEEIIRKSTLVFNIESIQQIVKGDKYRTISQLHVQPVSFKNGIYQILRQYIVAFRQNDQDYEN